MALLVRYNLPGHPDIVTIGVRSLATAVDHSVGAVRNAIEDLERRGLITPADPGPYGRARWTMAIEQKPEHAKAKPTTRRGEHARRQVREISGRFGPIG